MVNNTDYTIGWIAPLPLELTAACAAFDIGPEPIHVEGHAYQGGKIGDHYVVAAVQAKIGTDAASDLAARMRSAFKGIRFFLVVGIGGGVRKHGFPGAESEMVLGDVAVSYPVGSHGGVVQYDKGAWTSEAHLEFAGHTNGPPSYLLSTINSLRAKHLRSDTKMRSIVQQMRSQILESKQSSFYDPGPGNDVIFNDECQHPETPRGRDCEDCYKSGGFQRRSDRGEAATRQIDSPYIHYGNIGSSNQLQLSVAMRNHCQEEHQVICFEMEGAGVMHTHSSLIIRGICDYSDSHKNKTWQSYAALTAAAYAKELLKEIPPIEVEAALPNERSNNGGITNHWIGPISTGGGKFISGGTFHSNGSMNF